MRLRESPVPLCMSNMEAYHHFMTTQLRALRPVITQPEADFGTILGTVISPSRPLQSEEYLRGRAEQLSGIKKALYQPGRHALIHGFRGVGKSSLAQTAAYALSVGGDPILVSCDSHSTLASVIRDVCNEALNKNPSIEKKVKEASAGFTIFGFNASGKRSTQETAISEAGTVNEMVRSIKYRQRLVNTAMTMNLFYSLQLMDMNCRDEVLIYLNHIRG